MVVLKTGHRAGLIALAAATVVLSACVRAPAGRSISSATAATLASPEPALPEPVPADIDSVAVEVGIGSPIPLNIVLEGSFPNTCAQLSEVTQSMDTTGRRIEVQVMTQQTGGENCIDDPLPFRMRLPLNAVALGAGEQVVAVNGVETRLAWPPARVDHDAPAAKNMRLWLSQVLGVPDEDVMVALMEPVTFDDACLGAPQYGEVCAQVQTPGYEMTLYVYGEPYTFHVAGEGYRFRLIDRPAPLIGARIVTWSGGTDAEVGACGAAEVGTEGVAFGDCGGLMLGGRYIDGARRDAVNEFYARYAPFEADTPAGMVRFMGRGDQTATPVEQRMIAEWAKQLYLEARAGRTSATLGSVLSWDRSGGGVCEGISIRITGDAVAGQCGDAAVTQRLSAGQLERLYRWVDTFSPFTQGDDPQDETASERLVFDGRGSQTVTEGDRNEMLAFVREFDRLVPR